MNINIDRCSEKRHVPDFPHFQNKPSYSVVSIYLLALIRMKRWISFGENLDVYNMRLKRSFVRFVNHDLFAFNEESFLLGDPIFSRI